MGNRGDVGVRHDLLQTLLDRGPGGGEEGRGALVTPLSPHPFFCVKTSVEEKNLTTFWDEEFGKLWDLRMRAEGRGPFLTPLITYLWGNFRSGKIPIII